MKGRKVREGRDFKGVWIPRDIWLAEDLNFAEVALLTEIDSLSGQSGCFASNAYFAGFIGKSPQWVSRLIQQLKAKGYIKIQYEMNGKEIKKRVITPINFSNRGYQENFKEGINFSNRGYQENFKDNNTTINTDINNTSNKRNKKESSDDLSGQTSLTDRFENLWKLYPKKQGKQVAFRAYKRAVKKGTEDKDIELGIANYKKYIQIKKISSQYIKQGSTWFNQGCWEDEYDYGNQPQQKKRQYLF